MQKLHNIGALGGTFDHFHIGHQRFLRFAAEQAEHLIIGITNAELTQHKQFSHLIQPFSTRSQSVSEFCQSLSCSFEIVELSDVYGPTLGQRVIDCLIVTEMTEDGGQQINSERQKHQLVALPVYVSQMAYDENGKVINSTDIRAGRMSRDGHAYRNIFTSDIEITDRQREFLKKPFGEIVSAPTSASEKNVIAVVGDTCLANFIQNSWKYHVGIYDLIERRQPTNQEILKKLSPTLNITNEAGTISSSGIEKLINILPLSDHQPLIINHVLIHGEEDLLVIPLILLQPLQSTIYYGQPGQGMVEVIVTETLKEKIHALLSK